MSGAEYDVATNRSASGASHPRRLRRSAAALARKRAAGRAAVRWAAAVACATSAAGCDTTVHELTVFPPTHRGVPAGDTVTIQAAGSNRHTARYVVYSHEALGSRTARFRWETTDSTVATIGPTGLMRARRPGRVIVRATFQGITGSTEVEVWRPIASLRILPTDTTIQVDDTVEVRAAAVDGAGATLPDARLQLTPRDFRVMRTVAHDVQGGVVTGRYRAVGPGSTVIDAHTTNRRVGLRIVVRR